MSKNSVVSLTLQVKGQQASAELKRIAADQLTAVKKINTEQQKLAPLQAGQINNAKKFSDELRKQTQAFTAQKREALAVDTARKLGIRTEQQINAEIKKTHNSYAQLSILQRQGVVTAKDMERAYAAMKSRVAALNGELGKTVQTEKQIQQIQKVGGSVGMSLVQKGSIAGGAIVGAGYALQQPIKRTVDYDRDLHYAAQKLSDSPAEWKTVKKWMNTVVVGNAVAGGVDRDTSFLAMDKLLSDGVYQDDDMEKMKRNLAKSHFEASKSALASGGDIADFADVGLAAKKRNLDESKVQAMVIKADDLGAMSAKDVAKALPAQLGKLPVDKANGERQVAQLIALNEISMNTAGNAAEATTNVNNFLSKMYSDDTIQRLKKKHKINLPDRYASGKNSGKTDFDVFSDVVDEIIAKDKNSQALVNKISNAKNNTEKLKILETQQAIFEQSGLAGILPDMQALMALVASKRYGGNWEKLTSTAMTEGTQTRDLKYEYNRKELPSYGFNAADVTRKNSEYQTLETTVKSLGEMGTKVAELTEKYPVLVTAMGSTELALKALTVAAGGAAFAMIAGGKGDSPDLPTGTKTKGAPAVRGSNLLKTAGAAGLAYAGYELYKPIDDFIYSKIDGLFGGSGERPDFVQQAIDKSIEAQSQQNTELLAKQEHANKLSQDIVNKLNSLISVTQQNKPIPISTGNLLSDITNHAAAEEKRHGAFIPWKAN
jgi:hypothetical protein